MLISEIEVLPFAPPSRGANFLPFWMNRHLSRSPRCFPEIDSHGSDEFAPVHALCPADYTVR
jgi:hypothetical protein